MVPKPLGGNLADPIKQKALPNRNKRLRKQYEPKIILHSQNQPPRPHPQQATRRGNPKRETQSTFIEHDSWREIEYAVRYKEECCTCIDPLNINAVDLRNYSRYWSKGCEHVGGLGRGEGEGQEDYPTVPGYAVFYRVARLGWLLVEEGRYRRVRVAKAILWSTVSCWFTFHVSCSVLKARIPRPFFHRLLIMAIQ